MLIQKAFPQQLKLIKLPKKNETYNTNYLKTNYKILSRLYHMWSTCPITVAHAMLTFTNYYPLNIKNTFLNIFYQQTIIHSKFIDSRFVLACKTYVSILTIC